MYFNTFVLIFISLILYLIWRRKKSLSYFERHGIPHIKPNWFFGNFKEIFRGKPHSTFYQDFYRKLDPYKICGFYNMHRPEFIVRDPKLLKTILIKDFEYFQDHHDPGFSDNETFSKNLFMLKGEKWKNLRIKLTTMFTTGKMKLMLPLIDGCGRNLNDILSIAATKKESLEISEILSRYGIDAISSCVFGIETGCLLGENIELMQRARNAFQFRYEMLFPVLWPKIPKKLVNFFNITFLHKDTEKYFNNIVEDTIKYREKNNVSRNDFLNLAIALQNNTYQKKYQDKSDKEDLDKLLAQIGDKTVKKDVEITPEVIMAQSIGFFIGGADTIANVLTHCILELSRHPDIQDKVRDEINALLEANDGQITYELLRNMPYTDMVFAEILRKYPSTILISRECVKEYKVPDTNIIIPAGASVHVPLTGLHNDEKYYERPNDFYPEHFTDEAKARRPNYTYLPFGEGPRICIGQRLAMMKMKLALIYMIKDFTFSVSPKMKLPYKWSKEFGFKVEGGVWLDCSKI